jgi:hypothetical protein
MVAFLYLPENALKCIYTRKRAHYSLFSIEYSIFSSVALQSLKDPGRLTYRRFLELFRHKVGLHGRDTTEYSIECIK